MIPNPADNLSDQLDDVLDDLVERCYDGGADPYSRMMGWITCEAVDTLLSIDEAPPAFMCFDSPGNEGIGARIHAVWFKVIDIGKKTGASFGVWMMPDPVDHHVLINHFDQLPDTAA